MTLPLRHTQAPPTVDRTVTSCPACNKPFRLGDRKTTTITGRVVHERCDEDLMAAAAGIIASPRNPVVGALATRTWYRWLRRARR